MPLLCPGSGFHHPARPGTVRARSAPAGALPFVSYEEDPLAAFRRSSRHPVYRRRLLVAGAVMVVGVGAFFLWQRLSGSVSIEGLDDGTALGRSAVQTSEVRVKVSGRGAPTATLNGADFGAPTHDGSVYVWHLPNLADGTYHFEVTADRLLFGTVSSARSFTVDSAAPALQLPPVAATAAIDQAVTVDGSVNEPVTLTADGA